MIKKYNDYSYYHQKDYLFFIIMEKLKNIVIIKNHNKYIINILVIRDYYLIDGISFWLKKELNFFLFFENEK